MQRYYFFYETPNKFGFSLTYSYLCTHDTTKETTFGADTDGVEGYRRQFRHACFYSEADSTMALREAREEHRRDDKYFEAEPRTAERGIRGRRYGTHRLPTFERRHHQVPLSRSYLSPLTPHL